MRSRTISRRLKASSPVCANDGCFDAVLPYTARLPFRTKLAVSVTAITATETTEADEKPVFDLAFTASGLEPRKASATVVISQELVRLGR